MVKLICTYKLKCIKNYKHVILSEALLINPNYFSETLHNEQSLYPYMQFEINNEMLIDEIPSNSNTTKNSP